MRNSILSLFSLAAFVACAVHDDDVTELKCFDDDTEIISSDDQKVEDVAEQNDVPDADVLQRIIDLAPSVEPEPSTLIFTPDPEWLELVEHAIAYGHDELGLDWKIADGGVRIRTRILRESEGGRSVSSSRCRWSKCNTRAKIYLATSTLDHARGAAMVAHEMFHVASMWGHKTPEDRAHLPETNLMDYRSGSTTMTQEDVVLICSAAPCKKFPSFNDEQDAGVVNDGGRQTDAN
jgi:hypothetical protein